MRRFPIGERHGDVDRPQRKLCSFPHPPRRRRIDQVDIVEAMAAGAAGGVASVVAQGLTSPWVQTLRGRTVHAWHSDRLWRHAVRACAHVSAALLLGALFWLSWGLAGIVNVPWWLRGLLFGTASWLALIVPAFLSFAAMIAVPRAIVLAWITDWFITCVTAGVLCAWLDTRLV